MIAEITDGHEVSQYAVITGRDYVTDDVHGDRYYYRFSVHLDRHERKEICQWSGLATRKAKTCR